MKSNNASNNYVKNGLIFWLDGVDATPNRWVDKIGGLDFVMQDISFTNNGGVVFNGNSSQGRAEGVYNAPILECTIEVIFKSNALYGLILAPHTSTDCMTFGVSNDCLCSNTNAIWVGEIAYSKNTNVTMSIYFNLNPKGGAYPSGYKNKVPITIKSASYFSIGSGNYTTLGYRTESNRTWFNGILYQVRIYNRHLTDDEMLHNQSIDIKRYNIM